MDQLPGEHCLPPRDPDGTVHAYGMRRRPWSIQARDVTMICISRAPLEKLLPYRKRMGWTFDWASSYENDFNFDFGVSEIGSPKESDSPRVSNEIATRRQLGDQGFRDKLPPVVGQNASTCGTDIDNYLSEGHAFSVFARKDDKVYHCYSSYTRGTEFLMGYYPILDHVPQGRDEGGPMGTWIRRHDEYDKPFSKDCCA